MESWRIEWKNSAVRELKQLDRQVIPRIVAAVEALAKNPFPAGVKKIQGSEQTWRIRVGDYRVIYEAQHRLLVVEVIRVRHRKDVYR